VAIPDRRVKRFVEDRDTRVSVGLDFPVARQAGDNMGYFATTKTTMDAIKNDVKLLLMTQRGERLMQPFLGMDIRRFLFEQITDDTAIEIENDIVDTFQTWLPFVQLQDIEVDLGDQDRNQIKINVTFNVRNAPTELQSVGVVLE
tara:strand:+ start:2445 stop:2879 length:435 start_codon:yes stop_codon:yes gene_type:complete